MASITCNVRDLKEIADNNVENINAQEILWNDVHDFMGDWLASL